jgi:hypothetical protein
VIGGQGGGGGGGGGGGEEVKEAMDFFGRPIVVKYPSGLVDESGKLLLPLPAFLPSFFLPHSSSSYFHSTLLFFPASLHSN